MEYLHLSNTFVDVSLLVAEIFGLKVVECKDQTVFNWNGMVTVPLYILISVNGPPMHCDEKSTIRLWHDQCVQEGQGITCPCIFQRKLNALIYWVDILRNSPMCVILVWQKVSSAYLFHRPGGWATVLRAFNSKSSMKTFATMGFMGDSKLPPNCA